MAGRKRRKPTAGTPVPRGRAATSPSRRNPRSRGPASGLRRGLRWIAGGLVVGGFLAGIHFSAWVLEADRIVSEKFEGRRFSVPSRVYSAPLIVYPGMNWQRGDLAGWLLRLGYREQPEGGHLEPGRYEWLPGELRVHLRSFEHPLRPEPARQLVFQLSLGRIERILEPEGSGEVGVVVLEPEPVSAFLGEDREQRDLVDLDELPAHLLDAVYAVEDKRFEQHHGIDLRRVAGALVANLRAGQIEQGASTLTQQFVKNFFLTPERTFERKLREAVMALIVEARYTKKEILEAYLNEIYLGQRLSTQVHGVGEAARLYFGKSAADLSLSESALIAAIIQSPNRISPRSRPDAAAARRNLVLRLMFEQGRISEERLELALAEPLRVAGVSRDTGQVRYFLDALSRQLPDVYGADVLRSEGLRIYSTLNPRMQRVAARVLRSGLEEIETQTGGGKSKGQPLQGCLIALRPQTGEVLALVGGRDYGLSQWNRCTQARRQVGSVFKPFVYLAALDPASGPVITLADKIENSPLEIPTPDSDEPWRPLNYDKKFGEPVSVREAFERSLNVPAARLGERVGAVRVAATAHSLGITSPLPLVPSLALGTAEVTPLEIARAFATLANGGRRPTPRTFVDVVDSRGVAHENRALQGSVPAFDASLSYLGVSLLEGVIDRGTASGVRRRGLRGPLAGKTGTTDDESDLWFVGFTPELVALVWVGFDQPRPVGLPSSRGALPIWTEFMAEVLGDRVRGRFARPPGVLKVAFDPLTGARALAGCPRSSEDFFVSGTVPERTCPERPIETPEAEKEPPNFFRRTFRRFFGR